MFAKSKKALLNAGIMLALTFAMGAAFQAGVSLTSHFSPQVDVIEIRATIDRGIKL